MEKKEIDSEVEVRGTLPPIQQPEEGREQPVPASSTKERSFLPKVKGGFHIATAWAEVEKVGNKTTHTFGRKYQVYYIYLIVAEIIGGFYLRI